jgi:glycosyltransferase involved in cell wall biosynthesis
VSGTEIIALSGMVGLKKRGHEVLCVTNAWNDGDFVRRLRDADILYTELRLGKTSLNPRLPYLWWTINALVHLPNARRRYRRLIDRFAPDLVAVHGRDPILLLGHLLNASPVAFHVHEGPPVSSRARRVLRFLARRIDVFICVSQHVRDGLQRAGISPKKLAVVYNGVGTRSLRTQHVPGHASTVSVRIGTVGQVREWKGHQDLAQALALLMGEGYDFRWHIFGHATNRFAGFLRDEIDRMGLAARVEWRGFVRDPAHIYNSIDICVIPSRFEEPFGLVAVEAGLWGLPVVATRRGGLPEVVTDGETGLLVESNDPVALADRIRRLLDEPELRWRMGEAARDRVRRCFTTERMVAQTESIYNAIVEYGTASGGKTRADNIRHDW